MVHYFVCDVACVGLDRGKSCGGGGGLKGEAAKAAKCKIDQGCRTTGVRAHFADFFQDSSLGLLAKPNVPSFNPASQKALGTRLSKAGKQGHSLSQTLLRAVGGEVGVTYSPTCRRAAADRTRKSTQFVSTQLLYKFVWFGSLSRPGAPVG